MSSVTITKRQSSASKDFYAYYNEWTGEILSVGRELRSDTKLPYVVTKDKNIERIVNGKANRNNFLIAFNDDNSFSVFKKDKTVRLRKQEDSLFLISNHRLDNWDIRIKFYTVNNMMTVELNSNSIRRLTNIAIREQLKIDNKHNLNLFVIKKNQPDYLIDTIEINAKDLIEHDVVEMNVSHLVKHTSWDDIGMLTCRHFENYYFEVINNKYLTRTNGTFRSSIDHIYKASEADDAHILFEQFEDRLIVNSHLLPSQFDDVGLHLHNSIFYIVGNTPDELHDVLDLDIVRLRQGYIEQFEIDFDINDFNIIHNNAKLKIAKRKIQ